MGVPASRPAPRSTAFDQGEPDTFPELGKKRTTRKEVTGEPYWSRCHSCDEVFTTVASEDRHLTATHHSRYDVLERNP